MWTLGLAPYLLSYLTNSKYVLTNCFIVPVRSLARASERGSATDRPTNDIAWSSPCRRRSVASELRRLTAAGAGAEAGAGAAPAGRLWDWLIGHGGSTRITTWPHARTETVEVGKAHAFSRGWCAPRAPADLRFGTHGP